MSTPFQRILSLRVRQHMLNTFGPKRVQGSDGVGFSQRFKVHTHIALCPDVRTVQSSPYATPWQSCSREHHHDFSGKHSATLQLMHEKYTNTHHVI